MTLNEHLHKTLETLVAAMKTQKVEYGEASQRFVYPKGSAKVTLTLNVEVDK